MRSINFASNHRSETTWRLLEEELEEEDVYVAESTSVLTAGAFSFASLLLSKTLCLLPLGLLLTLEPPQSSPPPAPLDPRGEEAMPTQPASLCASKREPIFSDEEVSTTPAAAPLLLAPVETDKGTRPVLSLLPLRREPLLLLLAPCPLADKSFGGAGMAVAAREVSYAAAECEERGDKAPLAAAVAAALFKEYTAAPVTPSCIAEENLIFS